MIVLCLGLPSSASTWAFNVVRGLMANTHPDMLGVYAETAQSFQQSVPAGTKDVLLKTHSMDDALLRIIEASNSPMILTWRDPRDAAVSLSQRTSSSLDQSLLTLQRSAACMLSIKERRHKNMLVLDYADDYMNRRESIEAIARVLGVDAPARLVKKLHGSLRTDSLRKTISSWSEELGAEATFATGVDLRSHWHKNHLGDAKTGKWKDCDSSTVDLLDAMLGGHQAMFEAGEQSLVVLPWKALAQDRFIIWQLPGAPALQCRAQQAEVYLPRGWWLAELDLRFETSGDRLFEVRVTAGQTLLAQRVLRHAEGPQHVSIPFEHVQPVEAVLFSCAALDDKADLPVAVSDVFLKHISSAVGAAENKTRQVSQQVLPSM